MPIIEGLKDMQEAFEKARDSHIADSLAFCGSLSEEEQ